MSQPEPRFGSPIGLLEELRCRRAQTLLRRLPSDEPRGAAAHVSRCARCRRDLRADAVVDRLVREAFGPWREVELAPIAAARARLFRRVAAAPGRAAWPVRQFGGVVAGAVLLTVLNLPLPDSSVQTPPSIATPATDAERAMPLNPFRQVREVTTPRLSLEELKAAQAAR